MYILQLPFKNKTLKYRKIMVFFLAQLQKVSSYEIPEEVNAILLLTLLFRLRVSTANGHLYFYQDFKLFVLRISLAPWYSLRIPFQNNVFSSMKWNT